MIDVIEKDIRLLFLIAKAEPIKDKDLRKFDRVTYLFPLFDEVELS